MFAHRSSSGTHKGSDSEGQTHTDHMYRLPPVTFYRSRVSQSCSDSETVHETCCVNVNTTDATTGVTTLLLPAQNTHTLHDPK